MRALKPITVGAALAVLVVSLWPGVVWAQGQIAIYRVLPAEVTRDSVLKLAREAFGMSSPDVTEDGTTFMLQQEQKRLTVWKASGAMLFADDSKLWNPEYQITSPSDPESAVQLAIHFLKAHDLLPPQAVTEGPLMPIAFVHYVKGADGQEVPNHWSVKFTLIVDSRSQLGALGVDKAQLLIRLGQGGEVIGLDRHWRELREARLVTVVTPEQARELLAWKWGLPVNKIPSRADLNVGLFYNLHHAEDFQPWLYPVQGLSFLNGDRGEIGGGRVPASPFSVLTRITSPKPEARFQAADLIELRSEVRSGFGTPPYRYAWYSVKDGLLSQASTARVRLSPGLHQLWLYVTDQNGTVDFDSLFIHVEEPSQAAVGHPAWLVGIAIAFLGTLGFIGIMRRNNRRLCKLGLILLAAGLGLMAPGIAQQAGRFPPCVDQGNDSDCSLFNNKMKFRLTLTPNDGVVLSNFRWKTHLVYSAVNGLSSPYLELEFGGLAQPLKVELDATQRVKYSVKELQKDCTWEFRTEYDPISLPAVTQAGTPAGQEVQLKITQSYVFYNSKVGCSSAPEFYPQLRYELINLQKLAAGMSFQKIRVFLRADFDVEGTKQEQRLKTGQELQDVAVMVREDILASRFLAAIALNLFGGVVPFCDFDVQQGQIRPRVLQVAGERAVVICREKEFGAPTEKIDDFDNYHQTNGAVWIPGCSTAVAAVVGTGVGFPCVHLHQVIGYVTGDPNLPGGGIAGRGWMPQVKLKQKLYAVQYNANELNGDPEKLINNQKLTDIVMWWVFEADHSAQAQAKPQNIKGSFFPHEKRRFPWLYGAFSCGLIVAPRLNPLAEWGSPYCP